MTKINDLNGVIVTISEDGKLKCSYLGTEPAFINSVIKEDAGKQFNNQLAENEYRTLQSKIKNAIMNTGTVVTNSNMSGLILNFEIPTKLDQSNKNRDTVLRDPLDSIPSLLNLKAKLTNNTYKLLKQFSTLVAKLSSLFVPI